VNVQGATSFVRSSPSSPFVARVVLEQRTNTDGILSDGWYSRVLPTFDEKGSGKDERSLRRLSFWKEGEGKAFEARRTHLRFEWHEELREYYVRVIDETTNEVIREVPPKKWLDLVAHMLEHLGLLLDTHV